MTRPRTSGGGLLVALIAVVAGAGCAFFLGPVPCRDDTSCPYAKRCVDEVCVDAATGEGEGEGEGEPDIDLYDRFGQFEPNGRPVERCLSVLTADSIIRPPGSSAVLGLNGIGELADIGCNDANVIACEVPADDVAVPASCIVEADVAVCDAPALDTEGPRERCARALGTGALLLSFTRIDALLAAVGRMPDAGDIGLVLVDGDDDDNDSVFVRRDGKVITPGPIGAFDVDQPTGGQDCLALDEGGFHDALCSDTREVICQDPTGTFDGPGCVEIGGLLVRCPALSFDDGVDFCIEHGGIMAEIVNLVSFEAVTRVVVSPAWVGARLVADGGGDGGFQWLGGLPLRLE